MIDESANGRKFTSEMPPGLNFEVSLATPAQLKDIILRLQSAGRQTMNFRTMPSAGALILRDLDNSQIVGWQGFFFGNGKDPAEKFSLHLDPIYRSFLLGLALETVTYSHFLKNGVTKAMLRMDAFSNASLMDWRKSTGILRQVGSEIMSPEWLSMCGNCELYKRSCKAQAFFEIDIQKGFEFGIRRLGPMSIEQYPVAVNLIEDKIRQGKSRYRPKVAA